MPTSVRRPRAPAATAPHAPAAPRSDAASPQPRILILGAGPTGLGAGYRLNELNHLNFALFERHPHIGGLASSFTNKAGFTWDIGGHVMFSHYDYYDRVFDRLMGDEFTLNQRESWVRILGRWVPYPFQNNIRYLPREAALECLAGLVRAQSSQSAVGGPQAAIARAANFGELIDTVFGDGIARLFMRPYNDKVWAFPPETLSKSWIGERVAVIDIHRALRNVILEQDDFGWGPNNRFKFPLRGGTGEFYRRFGPILRGHIHLQKTAVEIDPALRTVRFEDGSVEPYDHLLSTLPLDLLCTRLIPSAPPHIRAAAARLKHSSGYFVGVGIRRPSPSSKCWMYFPEANCPFYRVTYLSNYSPFMTPDKDTHYSLLCETSHSGHKPVNPATIVEETIAGLEAAGLLQPGERADIVSTWLHHADYSYPTPTTDRDDILSILIPWLESHHIHSRGRFGLWKYEVSNTDHSLMQGVELVDKLLLGKPETTIGMSYAVTDDGRPTLTHGRPTHAGSGEKRTTGSAATGTDRGAGIPPAVLVPPLPQVVVVPGAGSGTGVPPVSLPSGTGVAGSGTGVPPVSAPAR
ncbi:MAG: FAD-dependent oxidoreductase [Phycisphaerales bacterium]